jgi:hypothetical protein
LEARTDIQGTAKKWYELRPCSYYHLLQRPKIIYASVAQRGAFTLDEEGTFVDKTCYFIPSADKYLLGLLNSQLLFFYFSHIAVQRRGGYYEYLSQYVSKLPVATMPPDSPEAREIVSLVSQMLDLYRRIFASKFPTEANVWQRKIVETNARIDSLVYSLYCLTAEEIRLVEGR